MAPNLFVGLVVLFFGPDIIPLCTISMIFSCYVMFKSVEVFAVFPLDVRAFCWLVAQLRLTVVSFYEPNYNPEFNLVSLQSSISLRSLSPCCKVIHPTPSSVFVWTSWMSVKLEKKLLRCVPPEVPPTCRNPPGPSNLEIMVSDTKEGQGHLSTSNIFKSFQIYLPLLLSLWNPNEKKLSKSPLQQMLNTSSSLRISPPCS